MDHLPFHDFGIVKTPLEALVRLRGDHDGRDEEVEPPQKMQLLPAEGPRRPRHVEIVQILVPNVFDLFSAVPQERPTPFGPKIRFAAYSKVWHFIPRTSFHKSSEFLALPETGLAKRKLFDKVLSVDGEAEILFLVQLEQSPETGFVKVPIRIEDAEVVSLKKR